MVLVMSVNPGFGGQAFMPESIQRTKDLRKMCSNKNVSPIFEVDGGVGPENIKMLSDAGIDYFVAGSTIFGKNDRGLIISQLKDIINEKP